MAMNKEPVNQRNGRSVLALLGLILSVGGVLYGEPLLALSNKTSDEMPVLLPVYTYLFLLLNPLNFYLNALLLLLLHDTGDVSPKKHLQRATRFICFATLVISAPLAVHTAVSEESIDLGISAVLVCLALVTIVTSVVKKCLICNGIVPAFLVLCISTGYLLSFDNPIHLPLLLVSFAAFTLGVVLVILRTGKIRGEKLVVTVLSGATGMLIVGWYMELVRICCCH